MSDEKQWKNRISGYGNESPQALLANPSNFRTHPQHQADALAGVLEEVGIVQNIVVNKRTGFLVDGHLRVALAKDQNQESIPVTYVDLSEAEEKEILATLDPITALATTDKEKLDELLKEVRASDARVTEMIERLAVKEGIIPPVDFEKEWQGMPEFQQDGVKVFKEILVRFMNSQDYENFAGLVSQNLTEKTKSIWYPKQDFDQLGRGLVYE